MGQCLKRPRCRARERRQMLSKLLFQVPVHSESADVCWQGYSQRDSGGRGSHIWKAFAEGRVQECSALLPAEQPVQADRCGVEGWLVPEESLGSPSKWKIYLSRWVLLTTGSTP